MRSRHEREKVEMLFAHFKRILKLDRLRLRGMSGATDEFTLAAAVQNLRRLYPQLMGFVPKNAGGLWFASGGRWHVGKLGAGVDPDATGLAQ
jgi:hypothetical protein